MLGVGVTEGRTSTVGVAVAGAEQPFNRSVVTARKEISQVLCLRTCPGISSVVRETRFLARKPQGRMKGKKPGFWRRLKREVIFRRLLNFIVRSFYRQGRGDQCAPRP